MTPNELLVSVKSRFSVLLVDNDKQFTTMLYDALRSYRDRAGVRETVLIERSGIFELPSTFLGISAIKDSDEDAVFENVVRLAGGNTKAINFSDYESYPITLSYFVDLTKIGVDEELPEQCIDLVKRHLTVQIERENDAQIKQVEAMGDGDISDYSTPETKTQELKAIEEQMSNEQSYAEILSVQPL